MGQQIVDFVELNVYRAAVHLAMEIFHVSQQFPREERYSLTDQIRRSSRSVCTNIAESWRKRRYRAAFVAKLSDAEGEASETQAWLDLAHRCGYLTAERSQSLRNKYSAVLGQLFRMAERPEQWGYPRM